MKTALPAECSASAVCVCVSVSELSVSLTHTGRNGFFLLTAYQVSPGSSVVAAAIHTGWIALMKTVSSWSLPVVLVLRQPVNTGKLQRKPQPLLLMWSARLPLFTLADSPSKRQSWVTSWVQGLFVNEKYLISGLTCDLFPTAGLLWILRYWSQVKASWCCVFHHSCFTASSLNLPNVLTEKEH